jgi:ribosomal biogenesis protein LAS1
MPLLHGLVSAALLPYPPQSSEQAHATRLSYAMSLVRFVNGMVDPLQTGPFARPISHLAATLQIPPSLISLRHRATHEDLPPIEALHASVHLALDYLHGSAFVPLLAPPEEDSALFANSSSSGPAEVLIKRWKKVMKERIREREVGNGGERGREVRNLKREFAELGSDVVDGLISAGGLVPLARK